MAVPHSSGGRPHPGHVGPERPHGSGPPVGDGFTVWGQRVGGTPSAHFQP